MECYCDSYSYPYRAEARKARKAHRCSECFKPIPAGSRYEYATGKCEGEWFSAYTCERCLDLREYVQAHVPCLCWEHGNANEEIIETAREWAHEAPGLLFGALRRQVRIDRASLT